MKPFAFSCMQVRADQMPSPGSGLDQWMYAPVPNTDSRQWGLHGWRLQSLAAGDCMTTHRHKTKYDNHSWGTCSMLQASMAMVGAVGMVIFSVATHTCTYPMNAVSRHGCWVCLQAPAAGHCRARGRRVTWGNSSMLQASMEMVNAVGMVIFRVPAWPPVMNPPVMLPKPRLGGPRSCSTRLPSEHQTSNQVAHTTGQGFNLDLSMTHPASWWLLATGIGQVCSRGSQRLPHASNSPISGQIG